MEALSKLRRRVPRPAKIVEVEAVGKHSAKETAKRVIEEVNAGNVRVPILSTRAQEAMALAQRPDATVRQLTRLIGPDPVMVAKIVGASNSPAYNTGATITSLTNALSRLGTGTVRDILHQVVIEATVFDKRADPWLKELHRHTLGVAHVARFLAEQLKIDPAYATLCGLVHDLGEVTSRAVIGSDEGSAEVIRLTHPYIGALTAQQWGLPAAVVGGVRRHHQFDGFSGGKGYSRIGNLLKLADEVTHRDSDDPALHLQPATSERIGASEQLVESAIEYAKSIGA